MGGDPAPPGEHGGTDRNVDQNPYRSHPAGLEAPCSAPPQSEVQAWATERSRRLSPSTLRLVVGTLRSIFNAAVRDRLVAHNPVLGLSLPAPERERIVPLTVDAGAGAGRCNIASVQGNGDHPSGLGLRIGELLALRLEDVDFLRRTVRVEWQTTVDGKRRVPPKTPRSRRTLPLPSRGCRSARRAHRRVSASRGWLTVHHAARACRGGTSTTASGVREGRSRG